MAGLRILRLRVLSVLVFGLALVSVDRLAARAQEAVPAPRTTDAENPVTYYRLVIPRVGADEWLRAAQALGESAPSPELVASTVREYERQLEREVDDVGALCAELRLREQLSQIAVSGSGAGDATALARRCFDRLKTRTWPRVDSALEEAWSRISSGIDPTHADAVHRGVRAKMGLLRAVYLRHTTSTNGWSSLGEGVDLRSLLSSHVGSRAWSQEFANIVRGVSGATTEPNEAEVDAAVREVDSILTAHEEQSMGDLAQYFHARRGDAAKLPAANEDAQDFAQTRHTRRIGTAQRVSERVFTAIDQVSTALEQRYGEEARADWEDLSWGAALGVAFQQELPTRAMRWIESIDSGTETTAACRAIHRSYLKDRRPLWEETRRALMDAKRKSAIPALASPDRSRKLDDLTAQRRALATDAITRMQAVLGEYEAARLEKYLGSLQQEWDPARRWRNI